jgi:hypothetical protein
VLGQALSQLKSIFGAAPTEGERKILLDLQASVDKTPRERALVLRRAIKLAQNRLAVFDGRAEELRSGSYYQPEGNKAKASEASGGDDKKGSYDLPQEAIEALAADPSPEARQEFDEVFGEGAATHVLGN